MKRSTSENPKRKAKREKLIKEVHEEYLELAKNILQRAENSLSVLETRVLLKEKLDKVEEYITHAERQMDQIYRRVILDETIPHEEKVFSIFEVHTEWISKGKAGVPVELGKRVCVLEDQFGFILHHQVMDKETDDKVAISMIEEAGKRFSELISCSFDKGFYTPSNRVKLGELLDFLILPKKGRLSEKDKELEYSEEFITGRKQHSAVESAINALEVHGLDRCPDHGIDRFKRYVALAVVARNIQKLGAVLQKLERDAEKKWKKKPKAA